MLTLGLFLEESNMRYPNLKNKKFIFVDKRGFFLKMVRFDDLDFAEREIIELKDLPNELEDNIYLIRFKISKRKYWKIIERKQ